MCLLRYAYSGIGYMKPENRLIVVAAGKFVPKSNFTLFRKLKCISRLGSTKPDATEFYLC
jgi:hypothetical protein